MANSDNELGGGDNGVDSDNKLGGVGSNGASSDNELGDTHGMTDSDSESGNAYMTDPDSESGNANTTDSDSKSDDTDTRDSDNKSGNGVNNGKGLDNESGQAADMFKKKKRKHSASSGGYASPLSSQPIDVLARVGNVGGSSGSGLHGTDTGGLVIGNDVVMILPPPFPMEQTVNTLFPGASSSGTLPLGHQRNVWSPVRIFLHHQQQQHPYSPLSMHGSIPQHQQLRHAPGPLFGPSPQPQQQQQQYAPPLRPMCGLLPQPQHQQQRYDPPPMRGLLLPHAPPPMYGPLPQPRHQQQQPQMGSSSLQGNNSSGPASRSGILEQLLAPRKDTKDVEEKHDSKTLIAAETEAVPNSVDQPRSSQDKGKMKTPSQFELGTEKETKKKEDIYL